VAADRRRHIYLNPVRAEHAEEFEHWLRAEVAPAVTAQRPDLDPRYEVLRATEPQDGTVLFAFVLTGGDVDDWDLEPLLERSAGPDGAERALRRMSEMLERPQYGWSFTPVDLR